MAAPYIHRHQNMFSTQASLEVTLLQVKTWWRIKKHLLISQLLVPCLLFTTYLSDLHMVNCACYTLAVRKGAFQQHNSVTHRHLPTQQCDAWPKNKTHTCSGAHIEQQNSKLIGSRGLSFTVMSKMWNVISVTMCPQQNLQHIDQEQKEVTQNMVMIFWCLYGCKLHDILHLFLFPHITFKVVQLEMITSACLSFTYHTQCHKCCSHSHRHFQDKRNLVTLLYRAQNNKMTKIYHIISYLFILILSTVTIRYIKLNLRMSHCKLDLRNMVAVCNPVIWKQMLYSNYQVLTAPIATIRSKWWI